MSLKIKRYPDLSEPLYFYGGSEKLRFSKSHWLYLREAEDGTLEPLHGVTNTVHIIDKPALLPWAVKMALKRAWERFQEHRRPDGFYELFETELEQILEDSKKADRDALEEAGTVGHVAHAWIESLIKSIMAESVNRTLEILAKLPTDERAANACIAAVEWMDRHRVRWLLTECRVYSRKYKYAGTLDGLALIDSCDDPLCCPEPFKDRLSITDWKTSNYLWPEHLLQTSAYWNALEEEKLKELVEKYGKPIDDRWVIRLGKDDAEFDPWHAPGTDLFNIDFEGFLQCLGLKLTLEKIQGRISDVKAVRKEYKKKLREAEKLERMKVRCDKADDYKGKRMTKCLPDGSQCQACAAIYAAQHGGANEQQLVSSESGSDAAQEGPAG